MFVLTEKKRMANLARLEAGVVREMAEALKRCRDVVDGVSESGDRPHNIVLIDALEAADAALAKLRIVLIDALEAADAALAKLRGDADA